MEEKRLEHPEERQDEKQEKKKQYPVTRRDFYGCVIILLIAIFLQGIQTRALIRRGNTQLENSMANRISSVESRIENIPNSIETALLEGDQGGNCSGRFEGEKGNASHDSDAEGMENGGYLLAVLSFLRRRRKNCR